MLPRSRWTASASSACSAALVPWSASIRARSSAATRLTAPNRSREAVSWSIASLSRAESETSASAKPNLSPNSGGGHWNLSPAVRASSARRLSSLSARAEAPARASRAVARASAAWASASSAAFASPETSASAASAAASSSVSRVRTASPPSISRISPAGLASTTARSSAISAKRASIPASRRAASPARACHPRISVRWVATRSRATASA